VAVDTRYDEVVLMDNNNWGLRVFNRLLTNVSRRRRWL